MKTCPRCGVENKPEKAACWNCWAPLEGPAAGVAQPRPVRRGLPFAVPWTMVAAVGLVIVAAAGTYYFLLRSRPANVAEQYLDAVRNGNAEKRDRLATRDTSGQSPLPDMILISSYEVNRDEVEASGGQATVAATLKLTVDFMKIGLERAILADMVLKHLEAHPVRAEVVLVKEGLNWRVDQMQTRQRFVEAGLRGMSPMLRLQLMAAAAPGPRRAAPGAKALAPGAGAKAAPSPRALTPGAVPRFGVGAKAAPRPGVPSAARPRGGGGGASKGGVLGQRRAAEREAESEF